MGNENERTEPLLGFDVGLGLKMQLQQPSLSSFDSVGGNNNTSHYERAYASAFPTSSYATHTFSSGLPGKAIFTASQWQELERQKMIHKYMVASVPVPAQLLLSSVHTTPSHVSQSSNRGSSLDLRFSSSSSSSGSDQEPWRCKRTDGKKWRCSRDVLPDQKYCERHAHKNRRTRSRKHVEDTTTLSPKNNKTSSDTTCSLQQEHQPLMFLSQNTSNSYSNGYPTVASSAASYNDQTRCIEWFMRGDSISSFSRKTNNDPVSTCNQQWQQPINQTSSSRLGSSLTTDNNPNKNVSLSSALYIKPPHGHEENKQEQVGFVSLSSYNNIPDTNHHHHQTTTRRFIDAWENEGKKLHQQPLSNSLTLSMTSGGHGTIEGDSDGILTTTEQWLSTSPFTWMNANYPPPPPPPGGPLGEALCLGNAITTRYCNSYNVNNDNSSSCSKSSCDEDGSNGLNCIGR